MAALVAPGYPLPEHERGPYSTAVPPLDDDALNGNGFHYHQGKRGMERVIV